MDYKKINFSYTHLEKDNKSISRFDNKFLTFSIAGEIYGIDIDNIIEIIEIQKITSVPNMSGYVKGIITLRGKTIPVINLRLRFNMEEKKYENKICIVIVNLNNKLIGFIVDTVLDVIDIPESEIEKTPQLKKNSGNKKYIFGIEKKDKNIKMLLDVKKIISQDELNKIYKDKESA